MSVHFANFHCINIKEIISNGKEGAWNILLTSIRCITHQLSILFIYCYLRRRIIDSYHVFQYFDFFSLQDNSFPQVAVWQRVLLIIWFINNSYIRYISLTYSLHNRFNEPFNMRLPSLCYYSIQRVWLFFRWNKLSLYKHVYLWDFFIFIDILDTFLDILLLYKIYTSFTSGYIKHYHTFNNTVSLPLDG